MRKSKYVSIESTTCLNFSTLAAKVKKQLLKKFPNDTEDEHSKRMYDSLRTLRINDQEFDFTSQPNHLGGVRWYILCPSCGKKSLKLYLPSKYKDKNQKYYCKSCHGLKNASSMLGTSSRYRNVIKPLRRLEKIQNELLKRTMTPEKAAPLLEEYQIIEKSLANSKDYKLYKFQKEHGIK